ncbi:MAG: hypothetical protein JJ863_13570 [Deltaproteobacteria bacterium]|nr:hypothetical protein [Deltaproteobacteria bacterium]
MSWWRLLSVVGVTALLVTPSAVEACECRGLSDEELRNVEHWCATGQAVVVSGTVERVRRSGGTEPGAYTVQLSWDGASVRPALPIGYPHERLQFGVWGDCVVPPRPGMELRNRAMAVRDTSRGPQLFAQDCVDRVDDDMCNTMPPGHGCRSCNVGADATPPAGMLVASLALTVPLVARRRRRRRKLLAVGGSK